MGKAVVRISVVSVTLYFVVAYLCAQFLGIDILNDYHSIPFEICVVVYAFSEGKYHCRYLKYTAITLPIVDLLSRLDNSYDFLSVTAHNLIPIGIIALGIATSLTLAIRHFIQVIRLRNGRQKTLANKANGVSPIGQVEGTSNNGL
jgi:hypothetical protein